MITHLGGDAEGQTPLDLDDVQQLRLPYVATRGELDAAEQANIVAGRRWALSRSRPLSELLDHVFRRRLHREMYGEVWKWAGRYRTSNKNIGIDWPQIGESASNLCADALLWCDAAGEDARDAAAVEFQHRLVLIHPFVNGNGRHARLMADLLALTMAGSAFSWGGAASERPAVEGDAVRAAYLDALRRADGGDLRPLVAFARS